VPNYNEQLQKEGLSNILTFILIPFAPKARRGEGICYVEIKYKGIITRIYSVSNAALLQTASKRERADNKTVASVSYEYYLKIKSSHEKYLQFLVIQNIL
jgi:hypothetical protein